MSEIFNLYPTLDETRHSALSYQVESPEFSYIEDYEHHPLQMEEKNEMPFSFTAQLRDPRCVWYPDSHNLIVKRSCSLQNPENLFGPEGLVARNAVIGIAVNWISTKSEQRGVIPFGEITASSTACSFSFEKRFEKSLLKGSLQLQTILYLKKSGKPRSDEQLLANNTGTVLGILDSCEIFIDGSGSVFPILTVHIPGKPLWWVVYDEAADPLQDAFDEENVEILLNTAHPHYNSLKIGESLKDSPLFLEVISSALMIIINTAKESLGSDWDNVLSGHGFAHGSIAEAIYYFVSKLQWDISGPIALSNSIREFFDKNLQGGLL